MLLKFGRSRRRTVVADQGVPPARDGVADTALKPLMRDGLGARSRIGATPAAQAPSSRPVVRDRRRPPPPALRPHSPADDAARNQIVCIIFCTPHVFDFINIDGLKKLHRIVVGQPTLRKHHY
ncbi:hypothetical protein EVAR_38077_1 [Eumeta japonica]|uniref:Uncharacterized protein n=1 Tax=Eumeta variegata TaxID=151549 RepID=A0A4C1W8C0_EUMVA|nr:hypothetical protein EVAR_38077_1 [Eumeta japonica]